MPTEQGHSGSVKLASKSQTIKYKQNLKALFVYFLPGCVFIVLFAPLLGFYSFFFLCTKALKTLVYLTVYLSRAEMRTKPTKFKLKAKTGTDNTIPI